LLGITLERDNVPGFDHYPFNLPAVKGLKKLSLHPEVIFFIDENGAKKSTLIKANVSVYSFNTEGGSKNFMFATRETHSELYCISSCKEG
jgi:predicted ATPase